MAYAKELIDAAGLTDEAQRKAFEQFLTNDKVRAKLEPTLREATEGVERERGRTAAETKKAKDAEDRMNKYYQDQLKLANDNAKVVADAQAEVARYVETYGQLPGGGTPTRAATAAAIQDAIDRKTFDDRTNAIEGNTVGLVTTAIKLLDQHRRDFPNEPFDVDAIVKTATEQKLTAAQAYGVVMGPKVEAARLAKVEAEKKAAVDAALLEERSKRGASTIVDASPRSEFMNNVIKSKGEPMTAKESFLKGWRDPKASDTMKSEFGREH